MSLDELIEQLQAMKVHCGNPEDVRVRVNMVAPGFYATVAGTIYEIAWIGGKIFEIKVDHK